MIYPGLKTNKSRTIKGSFCGEKTALETIKRPTNNQALENLTCGQTNLAGHKESTNKVFAVGEVEAPSGFFGAGGRGFSLARTFSIFRLALKN